MKIFGFTLGKKDVTQVESPDEKSFALPTSALDDGAVTVTQNAYYGTYVDLEGSVRNELELITRYREMSNHPELESAIDDIVNESITHSEDGSVVQINTDNLKQPESIKKKITEEYNYILKLLNFSNLADDLFRRWYIDGRIYFHVIVNEKNPKEGIQELRYIDPRKIRKIREINKERDPITGANIIKSMAEYYVYNDKGTSTQTYTAGGVNQGIRVATDSIINVNSGLMDAKNNFVISPIHNCIKPLNQLRMIEDAIVVYRISRSPERRVFYIDVGNLPKGKAEQYLRDVMVKYRNKMTYDASTGCLAMDTKVPLLDGRTLTISEISDELKNNKELWTYSCDPNTGKFVPGLITWAGVTQKSAKVMKITFDNGKSLICTLNHKHVTKDRGFVEAKDLQINDSMMPHEKGIQNEYSDFCYKIVNIEYLNNEIEVGTLTIDGQEKYHNYHTFALDCGIYTKNSVVDSRKHMSMLEDFFLPRREGCVSENTVINLLDGRKLTLKDLIIEYKIGKENWVYSVSPTGKIVPGKISWAGITRLNAEVLDIHLDNGEVITATPDHKFILRNGEKIEAKDLQIGSSLMPFNTRFKNISHNRGSEYFQIHDNEQNKWRFAHTAIAEFIYGPKKPNQVTHHIDFCRHNQTPSNLVYMDKKEHYLYHCETASLSWQLGDVEERKRKLSISGKKFFETEDGLKRRQEISEFNKVCPEIKAGCAKGRETIKENRKLDKETMTHEEYLAKWSPGLSKMGLSGTIAAQKKAQWERENLSNEEWEEKCKKKGAYKRQQYAEFASKFSLEEIINVIKIELSNDINLFDYEIGNKIQNVFPEMNLKRLRHFIEYTGGYESISYLIHRAIGPEYINKKRAVQINPDIRNHKVVKIVPGTPQNVGTLTIDENHEYHDYHNFGLSAGIFVMNSRGTEITTLPAGAALNDLPDLEYFKKKLLQSLHVPYSRMDNDNGGGIAVFGRSAETSRDELKFGKFIQRLRNKFSQLFDDALRIQLALKGICTTEEWEEFKEYIYYDFRKDNNFVELREAELIRERMITLSQVDPYIGKYFSQTWVKKNILRMTDEEIEEMSKEMEKDGSIELYQQQLMAQSGGEQPPEPFDNTYDSETSPSMTPNLDDKVSRFSP